MITLQNAIVGYDHTPLFPPLCGRFAAGSLTAVIGVNGAGKSTLLKSLAGLHPLLGGKLHFAGGKATAMADSPQLAELDCQFPDSGSGFGRYGLLAAKRPVWRCE